MRRPTAREYKDASRTAFLCASTTAVVAFTFAYAGIPAAIPGKGTFRSNVVRDISWLAVSALSIAPARLGDAGGKCLERLLGNCLGAVLGLAAVVSRDPFIATAIAALTGFLGQLMGPVFNLASAGNISSTTYVVVAMPALSTFGLPRSWEVDKIMAKQAAERVLTVTLAIVFVYLLSIAWYPHAASEEAFDHAAATISRVREMGVSAFAPAAVLDASASVEEGGDGGGEEHGADVKQASAAHHPPMSKREAARAAVRGAYLSRIQTLALRPVLDQEVRSAHLAEVEGRLAAAVAARSKLQASLGVARKEIVVGRLPFPGCRDGMFGSCVSGGGPDQGVRRRAGAQVKAAPTPVDSAAAAFAADATVAANAALPTPAASAAAQNPSPPKPAPATSNTTAPAKRPPPPPPSSVSWCPVYVPTIGTGGSAWIRRMAPRHFGRRALPSAQLEDVGRACSVVGRALWMVGDAAGGGFSQAADAEGLSDGGAGGPAPLVAELSCLVEEALTEALDGVRAARKTFVAGRAPADGRSVAGRTREERGLSASAVLASVRSRWPTLGKLQRVQARLVGTAAEGERPEEGLLRAGGLGGGRSTEAASQRVRFLTLLFGVSEARRGLEDLAAAVEALRDACEGAAQAKKAGVALLEDEEGAMKTV